MQLFFNFNSGNLINYSMAFNSTVFIKTTTTARVILKEVGYFPPTGPAASTGYMCFSLVAAPLPENETDGVERVD